MFDRICILGVGLIGGSVACAARARGLCRGIIGIDRNRDNLRTAVQLGIIDTGFEDIREVEGSFDLVMFATPVGSIGHLFEQMKPMWSSSAVYTDAGSTKGNVIQAAKSVFGRIPENFVPGHPIAGGEQSGVAAASADLYRNKRVILTPLAETDAHAIGIVADFWRKMGARVSMMEPSHHDD
ncbi:MAG: prephenate dehydrogenase/arogenate dehydrogenase family protein, partial [Methylococcaceae bacterium]|nr:prephenate dehydrogenase/arogenate dehydrogenase family protein [Methylococcaceae bacterium]